MKKEGQPIQAENKNEEQADGFRLGVYVMALRTKYPEIVTFEDQVKALHDEFGINVTERQLWLLEEPTVEEEELDYRLMYNNLNL